MKKIFALMLAAVMILAVAGCGGSGGGGSVDTDGGEFSQSEIKLPEYKPTANEVVMLTSMDNSMLDDPNQWYYSFNEKLKLEYGVAINHLTVTANDLAIKASQLVISGDSPDLIEYRDQDNPTFIKNGIVQPVDDYFDFDEPVFKHLKDINQEFRYSDGKLYTFIRSYRHNAICYYWLEDLAELGLETPRDLYYKGQWNWSKFEEYAGLLTQKATDGTISRHGAIVNSNLMHTITGETLVKYMDGAYINNLRSPKLANYYNTIQRLIYETKVMPPNNVNLWDYFKGHGVSMALDMRNLLDNHLLDELSNDLVSFAPVPKWDDADKYYLPANYGTAWIAKGAKNIDGARAWFAVYCLLNGGIDPNIEDALNQLAVTTKGFDEGDFAMLEELKDPEKFTLVQIRDVGLGTMWSTGKRTEMMGQVLRYNKPWATAVEEYAPILSSGIEEMK